MIAWGAYRDMDNDASWLATRGAYTTHDYWLVFNECEHNGQCDSSPEEAADFYHEEVLKTVYEWGVDADAQLIIGGVNANPCGLLWLTEFVRIYRQRYGEVPRAGWHFHVYPEVAPEDWSPGNPRSRANCSGDWVWNLDIVKTPWISPTPTATPQISPTPSATPSISPTPATPTAQPTIPSLWPYWEQQAESFLYEFIWVYGRPDDEIWLTETGCLHPAHGEISICGHPDHMYQYSNRILEWLNTEGTWVDRYNWFTDLRGGWSGDRLFVATATPSSLTPTPGPMPLLQFTNLGDFYSRITPAAPIERPRVGVVYLPGVINR